MHAFPPAHARAGLIRGSLLEPVGLVSRLGTFVHWWGSASIAYGAVMQPDEPSTATDRPPVVDRAPELVVEVVHATRLDEPKAPVRRGLVHLVGGGPTPGALAPPWTRSEGQGPPTCSRR